MNSIRRLKTCMQNYTAYKEFDQNMYNIPEPGHEAQSVTCLAIEASMTADPGDARLIQAWSHTFVEIDHEIISMVILLPSAE